MDIHVARQPIFNRFEKTVAYELLYRNNSTTNQANIVNADQATISVIKNSLINIGISRISEGKKLFINFTENLLLLEAPFFFSKEEIVIEILEDVMAKNEVLKICQKLKDHGYSIALDDFVLHKDNQGFLPYADIIKVDFLNTSAEQRMQMKRKLSHLHHIHWLAEKVETREQMKEAMEQGYHFFQGYFFCEPMILSGESIPHFSTEYFKILKELNQESPNIDVITDLIEKDLPLAYQLLKLLNKAAFYTRQPIKTIRQAIMIIGFNHLKKWMAFLFLNHTNHKCSEEIIQTSLIRANTLEKISPYIHAKQSSSQYFLLGLFSVIDVLIGRPMEEILKELPLDVEIKRALLNEGNDAQYVLNIVKQVERGNWDDARDLCTKIQLNEEVVFEAYHHALLSKNIILI
ncbi:EAL and modified HD-GYP domain-containing signal transduction protein [Oikeobacillus pervagus]|uniref:EAL and modified HD-GYP domain-containing signal transduction protein n=1 Tax=Oikeobacillus pervagus TaxID=1325931 RepID=A0AAJ1T1R9_9BACI|nr:HDOD domain-containing protein [Oikeobacillus pervagus]MDQ0214359.1 EAL and modified HD-GYP domain-containing signal transduction protein [Oikeobacillus pervagus]